MRECVDNLPPNVVKQIGEIDEQLNSLSANGFEDTSIANLNAECKITNFEVFSTWFESLPKEIDEILNIGENIKCVVRLACEGSSLDVQKLSALVYDFLKVVLNGEVSVSVEKIQQLIPVLLTKKNLDKNGTLCYYWESPYIEMFPEFYVEKIKGDRSSHFSILRKYRAIERVRDSLISGEYEAIDKANEALNKILKMELEKKEKLARRKSLEEQRERERELKKQEAEAKKRERERLIEEKKNEIERKKKEKEKLMEQKKIELEAKRKEREREKELKNSKKREREQVDNNNSKNSGFNILLKWLKPETVVKTESISTESLEENYDEDVVHYVKKIDNESQKVDLKKIYLKAISDLSLVNSEHKKTTFLDCVNKSKEEVLGELENFIKSVCKNQRETWNVYVDLVANPSFVYNSSVVDNLKNEKEGCEKNLINNLYLDETLPEKEKISIYHMYDNTWKRPFMKLIVNKCPKKAGPINPIVQEAIDYSADTDDEWFEQCDFDNVEEEGSEPEEEEYSDELEDWLVPDGEIDVYNVLDNKLSNCAVIYSNNDWTWTLDGVEIKCNENLKNSAGFYGFNNMSINPLDLDLQEKKFNITANQEYELVKYCHGKSCSREKLVEELKLLPQLSMVPKAAINRCLAKNFTRQKKGNKITWIITQDVVLT